MGREIKQVVRDRYLTEEEAAKYRKIRELVADEVPELRRQAKARLQDTPRRSRGVRRVAQGSRGSGAESG